MYGPLDMVYFPKHCINNHAIASMLNANENFFFLLSSSYITKFEFKYLMYYETG